MDIELSRMHKGILLLITGTLLFLYSTGLITRGLSIIIIITSLGMIAYGFRLVEGQKFIQTMIAKSKEYQAKKLVKRNDQDKEE